MGSSRSPAGTSRKAGGEKQEAILEAALHLFVERGFHGTAVPAIAERAGVGAGTIYRYFENKDALVNALYRRWKDRLGTHLLSQFDPSASARGQFGRVWSQLVDFVERHPTAYAFLELHHHQSYLDAESRAVEQRLFELAISFLRVAQSRGEIRNDPPELLWSLVEGAFLGLVRSAREHRVELTPEILEAAESAVWQLIAAG